MASCKLGHVYIVNTVLTKPPKAKFAVCVCDENGFFVWINSKPRPHGKDQLPLDADCHELVTKDCFLDLSRVVKHPTHEVDSAKEFSRIDADFALSISEFIDAGLFVMPPIHATLIREKLLTIL